MIFSDMVKVSRILKCFGGNALFLSLLGFAIVGYLSIKILGVSVTERSSCIYDEPVDVVYTWVNGSDPRFLETMNEYLKPKRDDIDSSKQRYEDKNELRFSLRSLEKFAPWVNHVYLVTNGQIPYWLNLDYEKITIVTHDDIFRDTNNLPTFSSPAIESNLYRIPGLTKKFIYFNDDIFIGQQLYLEDFYTTNKGYMIFLDYSLPGCTKNCPWLYVGDGQCDRSCNVPNCQFDGGDCDESVHKQVIFAEDVFSMENTETYNEKVNREFEILKQKVRENFDNGHIKKDSDVNSSVVIQNDTLPKDIMLVYTKDKTENDSQPIDGASSRINLSLHKRDVNMSVSKLVEEHNMKILQQNKKLSRKRRHVNKDKEKSNGGSRSAGNIDGYLESLLYTQRLLNKKFGYKPRYVPAHAPILIDKDIMEDLQNTFPTEFELTERNKFRHDNDVQFGFSYYYFLMSDRNQKSVEEIFDEFDTDNSGTWSDREIRNILTKIYELPLTYEIVDHFEGVLINCSELQKYPEVTPPPYERYIDSRLPTITKDMITKCPFLSQYLTEKFAHVPKYKYEIVRDSDGRYSTFRMLVSNITHVVIKLDEIRSKMTKFVCLNDNLEESRPSDNELVRAILYDFYLSLFPHPSKFELPEYSRNRFLYMDELNEWKRAHSILKLVLVLAIVSMMFLTFFNVFKKGCCKICSQLFS